MLTKEDENAKQLLFTICSEYNVQSVNCSSLACKKDRQGASVSIELQIIPYQLVDEKVFV